MNYSNPALVFIRSCGQKMGVLRPVARMFRKVFKVSYEDSFDSEMMRQINNAETIWDVGANQGIYTKKFADKVGADGSVVAFEPSPITFASLQSNTSHIDNVTCMQLALASQSGRFGFKAVDPNDDTTNRLSDRDSADVFVEVSTADELVENKKLPVPNAVKIDVEGFEIDVIKGMLSTLKNPKLKKLFIEVHFLELKNRGFSNAAREMTQIIENAGFDIAWTDPSHFIGTRKSS